MMMMMIRWDAKKNKTLNFHKKTDISIKQLRTFHEFSTSILILFGKDTMKNHSISKEQNLSTNKML